MSQNDCQSPCVTKTAITTLASQTGSYPRVAKYSDCTPRVTEDDGHTRVIMTTVYTTNHIRQRYTPCVTKYDGIHHVSQKTKGIHHVSRKTTVNTTCHKRRRYKPRVTRYDGTNHVSQRRRYTPRVTKTTVHTTCRQWFTPVSQSTKVVRLCHEGQ